MPQRTASKRVSGSASAAAELREVPRAGGECARELGEDRGLRAREGGVVVGRREMRHEPRKPQRAAAGRELAPDRERVGGRHAPAAHARVGLDVHVAGDAGRAQPA